MRKNVVNNKSLNFLLKNKTNSLKSKKKDNINNIINDKILFQKENINGNYKSFYYFDEEIYDKENNSINIKHFNFKDFYDEQENSINEEKKSKKKINNNTIKINEVKKKTLFLNLESPKGKEENKRNQTIENKTNNQKQYTENNNINNSYKIINESKYNNKSKVTIYLISNNNQENLAENQLQPKLNNNKIDENK